MPAMINDSVAGSGVTWIGKDTLTSSCDEIGCIKASVTV